MLSTLLVLAVTAAGVAFLQQRVALDQRRAAQENERIAIARQLTTQAGVARDSDPRTALLLGVAAQHIHADPETRASLMHTLTTTHYGGTLTGHTGAVFSVAFAPDGRTLATGGANRVILWDLAELNDLRAHAAQRACDLTDRGLNRVEWRRYISGLPYQDTCAG